MSTIDVNLPALNVEQALTVFPELDAQDLVLLAASEATLQMKQAKSDWASMIQVQADSGDVSDLANGDDVKYKITSAWPSYSNNGGLNEVKFQDASFNGDGHSTLGIGGGVIATDATTLRTALRYDISEDYVGTKDAFDIFSNEGALNTEFNTQADQLETNVSDTWGNLLTNDTENGVVLGAGILSNATASENNPAKTIVQAILNSESHPSKATIADNLAARADTDEGRALFADCPLVAGDKLNFNVTFLAPTGDVTGPQQIGGALSASAPGPRPHTFQVEVQIVD